MYEHMKNNYRSILLWQNKLMQHHAPFVKTNNYQQLPMFQGLKETFLMHNYLNNTNQLIFLDARGQLNNTPIPRVYKDPVYAFSRTF